MICLEKTTKLYKGDKLALSCEKLTLCEQSGGDALLGDDGAGKTTLAKLICGMLRPTSGNITVDGHPAHTPEATALVGYMPSRCVLEPRLTASESLSFLASSRGLEATDASRALDAVELSASERRIPAGLLDTLCSKRLSLASALLGSPKYLVLDGALAELEPDGIETFTKQLKDLASSYRFVYTTDSPEEAAAFCANVTVLSKGKVLTTCPVDTLTENSTLPYRFKARVRADAKLLDKALSVAPYVRSYKLSKTPSGTLLLELLLERDHRAVKTLSGAIESSGGELLELKRADTPLESVLSKLLEKDEAKKEQRRERELLEAPPIKLNASLITFRHENDGE